MSKQFSALVAELVGESNSGLRDRDVAALSVLSARLRTMTPCPPEYYATNRLLAEINEDLGDPLPDTTRELP